MWLPIHFDYASVLGNKTFAIRSPCSGFAWLQVSRVGISRVQPMNLAHQLVKNSIARAWQLLASLLIAMALPPLIIRAVGLKAFGAWVIIQAISQLSNLFNLALQPAIAKYVAEFRIKGEYSRLARVISAAFMICGVISGLFMSIYLLVPKQLLTFLSKGNTGSTNTLNSLMVAMLIVTGLGFVNQVHIAVMNGFQRMDQSNNIAAAGFLINGLFTIVFLSIGLRMWALVVAAAVSTTFLTITCWYYARRLMSTLPYEARKWAHPDRSAILSLLTLGSSDITIAAVTTGWSSGIRLLLGAYTGPSNVAYYDLAQRFRTQLQIFPSIVNGPLGPAASELEASQGKGAGGNVATAALRFIHMVTFPMFMFCILMAHPLAKAWLGNEYGSVALCIQILAVPTYITVVNGPAYNTLIGLGNPLPGLKFSMISFTVNITVTTFLAIKFGLLGAVIGESVALGLAAVYFFARANQAIGIPLRRVARILIGPAVAVITLSPLLLLLSSLASAAQLHRPLLIWFTVYLVFAGCVYYIFRRYRFISDQDLSFLRNAAMAIVGRRRE